MLSKKEPPHPGVVLKELYLADLNLTQVELAKKIGCHVQKINEIVNGRRGITAEFAVDLSLALKTSAELWMNLQTKYDLWHAFQNHKRAS